MAFGIDTYVVAVVRFVRTKSDVLDTTKPAMARMQMVQRKQALARKDVPGEAHQRGMEFPVPLVLHLLAAFPVLTVQLELTAVHCPLRLREMGYQAAWLAVAARLDLHC